MKGVKPLEPGLAPHKFERPRCGYKITIFAKLDAPADVLSVVLIP